MNQKFRKRQHTQYKRKPLLVKNYNDYFDRYDIFYKRSAEWFKILDSGNIIAINSVARYLALCGFPPNVLGILPEDMPKIPKMNPLYFLNAWDGSEKPSGEVKTTLEWKADVLEAATLVHFGIINMTEEAIQEACPQADVADVSILLDWSDLDAFWKRPGVGMDAEKIREKWDHGEHLVTARSLADMLQRSRGGT